MRAVIETAAIPLPGDVLRVASYGVEVVEHRPEPHAVDARLHECSLPFGTYRVVDAMGESGFFEVELERTGPTVVLRTVLTGTPGLTIVYAERVAGGSSAVTRLLDTYGGARAVLLLKRIAIAEATDRWGAPARVRFETVDRRDGRQLARRPS